MPHPILTTLLAASVAGHVVVALRARRRGARTHATALAESEARLALALESTRMGWYTIEGDSGRVTWSEGFGPLWGLPRGFQPPGVAFVLERIHPDDLAHTRAAIAEARRTGGPVTVTYRVRHADGSPRWFTTVARMEHPQRMLGIVRDVTAEQGLLDALAQREQRLRTLVAGAGTLILGMRADFTIFEWNDEIAALFGVAREDAVGTSYLERFIPPERHAAARERMAGLMRGEALPSFETVVTDARGEPRTIHWRQTRLTSEHGGDEGIVSVGQDVTVRVRVERTLAAARDHLEAVIQSSADGIVTFDRDLRITGWSRAMAEHTGKPASEVVGRIATELFPSMLTNARGAAHRAAIAGETVHLVDVPFHMRLTGRDGWTDESYAPIRDRDGAVVGGIVLVRDVTPRRLAQLEVERARHAAEAASRAKSDFLARMSHELRTPLTAIIGFSNFLVKAQRENATIPDAQRKYLGRVAANGSHLLGIINDILDLSRIEAGHERVHLAPAALDALVLDVVQLLEQQAQAGVRLVAEVPAAPGAVRPLDTDAQKLRQVLVNLVGNALKFTHAGQVVVRLRVDASGRPEAIEVQDTGIGIPHERHAAIFEAFEQEDGTTARHYGGTGLGLAISRRLCDMLGATLTLESEPGVGTTFRVAFVRRALAIVA